MKNNSLSSYDLLWLSLTVIVLVTLSFLFTVQPQDYWWCLRVGRDTLLSGAVPVTENLSWSQVGHPIVYEPWLSCVTFWLVYSMGGGSSTFLLRGLLIGLSYGIIWFLVRQASGPRLATILVILIGLAGSNNWEMRAQLFAYPLFACCLYCLTAWQTGNNKTLWILPLVTILWSNLHGSFVLSFILAGSALVFGKGNRRLLLIVLIVMLMGTLLNPRGFVLWEHVQFMLTTPSNQLYSVEWQPPRNAGWQMNIFFAWILAFAPLAALSARKISIMGWVWFLGFGWLALSGTRYVIWFLFILVVLTAAPLADATRNKLDRSTNILYPAINIVLACIFIPLPLLYLPGIRENWWSQPPSVYASSATPFAAVKWLENHPDIPGPLWNDYAFGSYLSFALPTRPVWFDSRFFPYPAGQVDEYQKISRGMPEWESLLQLEGINLLLLSFDNQPNLIRVVESSLQWCEQYRDDDAVIFTRCEPIQ